MPNKPHPNVNLDHLCTLKDAERVWVEISGLKETLINAMDPEIHGTALTAVCTLPAYSQVLALLRADLTKREVSVLFETTDNSMLPALLKHQQDEVRVQVLRKVIEQLKPKGD